VSLSLLDAIERSATVEIEQAKSSADLERIRAHFLGPSGKLREQTLRLGTMPVAERPRFGAEANRLKLKLEALLERRLAEMREAERRQERQRSTPLDLTLPGRRPPRGTRHPLTQVHDEIVGIFMGLGFSVAEGPEIESDENNFELLNIPRDHPARDMQDTFYLSPDTLLRTHTSPVQIRAMKVTRPPVRIVCPGRVYRRDVADASHLPVFHQVEGLAVDRDISMGDLRGTLERFAREMFGPRSKIRFRPSYFPFTEPSAEVDVLCFLCGGQGCRVCKQSGWLEILGSGMVHPQVLRNVGYDPEEVTGWAFGMGIDRVALLKYGIDDIRLFFENDLRFLKQFA
jgi:phenylalanyl-tRNA synthetase alpha chain